MQVRAQTSVGDGGAPWRRGDPQVGREVGPPGPGRGEGSSVTGADSGRCQEGARSERLPITRGLLRLPLPAALFCLEPGVALGLQTGRSPTTAERGLPWRVSERLDGARVQWLSRL